MSLLVFDGVEGLTTAQLPLRWATNQGSVVDTSNPVPSTGYCLRLGGSTENNGFDIPGVPATVIVGWRMLPTDLGVPFTAPVTMLRLSSDDAVQHINIFLNANGSLSVFRRNQFDSTLLGTTSETNLLRSGVWAYVEVKATVSDTVGAVQIKIDGIEKLNLTNVDTKNSGEVSNANISRIRFVGRGDVAAGPYIDDVYICDTLGDDFNDFLGSVRAVYLLPNAPGDSTQWTPSAGQNWECVDDPLGHDGDTTRVTAATAGLTDLYNISLPVTLATEVKAIKITTVAKKTEDGAQNLELLIKSGTTTDASSPVVLSDTYAEYSNIWVENPDTESAWVVSDITDLQTGFRIPT